MSRILLTGGSGFIASHILEQLLQRGHSVRFTVRTEEQARKLLAAHARFKSRVDAAIVEDIGRPNAFDAAMMSDPPFDAVIHTASPARLHHRSPDALLTPAIQGTQSLLHAAATHPSIHRVVYTSSFGTIYSIPHGTRPGYTYTSADWNAAELADATASNLAAYRVGKTLAERAAWDFVAREKPRFDFVAINPPRVFGPVMGYIHELGRLNTTNQIIYDAIAGRLKDAPLPPTVLYTFVDVRDVAAAHVKALDTPEAAGKRFIVAGGYYSNEKIVDIIRKQWPEMELPRVEGDGMPEGGVYAFDAEPSRSILGIEYRGLEECIEDTVRSLKELGA
ncbi:hypothetical protein B0H19DRAFT_1267335 [Mycena capillaripes]|nr:hypothetical protein B0H19DRAFT_1267335 [Mycena capillaripes]